MKQKNNKSNISSSGSGKPNLVFRSKILIGNISSLFVLQAANYIFPLITLPYLVRILGPENFGLYVFAQIFIQYFVILTDYGFNYTATRQISIERNNIKKRSEIYGTVMLIKLGLTLISFGLLTVIVFTFPKFRPDWLLYYSAFLLVLGNVLFPQWLFQGMERMRYITIINIVVRTIGLIVIFVFVKAESDYVLAVLIVSLTSVLIGLVGTISAVKLFKLRPVIPSWMLIKRSLKDGWPLFISTAAISLYTTSTIFVLGLFSSNTIVGYFGAAEKIVRAVRSLIGPITQAIYPHISAIVSESKDEAIIFLRRTLKWMSLGSFALSAILFLTAEIIVSIGLGPDYKEAVILIRIMALLPFIIALSNVSGVHAMLGFGFNKTFSRVVISAGLLNTVLIFPLVILYQAEGAAISVMVSELFVVSAMFFNLRRKGINLIK
ncbi:MAG: flippase [candidate division Zixibacteria bacterium]|nr:flippase [candidate division Zixibacteria bacterium]